MSEPDLVAWLKTDLARAKVEVADDHLAALVLEAKRTIQTAFSASNPLRPSRRRDALARLAKRLDSTIDAIGTLDDLGREFVMIGAGFRGDSADLQFERAVFLLCRLSAGARLAEQGAGEIAASEGDGRGGPTPDRRLRTIAARLMCAWEQHLGLRPKITIDRVLHYGETGVARFIKEALRAFAPADVAIEGSTIDAVVVEFLPIRDLEEFDPEPLKGGGADRTS